jgi:hypothetical protein
LVPARPAVKDLFEAAGRVQEFLDARKWRSCIIGGIAVLRWGEPRLTRDVDVTLLTGIGDEERFVDEILKHFSSRIPEARDFALTRRVLLLTGEDGTGIDLALGGLPFEENAVQRASRFEFYPGMTLRTCSAEDLIVMKAFADRDQDWLDVRGIIDRQPTLDWGTIFSELEPLSELKGAPEIMTRLKRLRSVK